jgi:hypothetical protein
MSLRILLDRTPAPLVRPPARPWAGAAVILLGVATWAALVVVFIGWTRQFVG